MRNLMLLFLFSMSLFTQAQVKRYLVMEHRTKPREVVFNPGEFVVVRSVRGERIRGPLEVIDEQLIGVKNKVIPLTNVEAIGRRSKWANQLSSFMISAGLGLLQLGIQGAAIDSNGVNNKAFIMSAPMLVSGTGVALILPKRKRKNWKYIGVVHQW